MVALTIRVDVVPSELGHAFIRRFQMLRTQTHHLSSGEASVEWVCKCFRKHNLNTADAEAENVDAGPDAKRRKQSAPEPWRAGAGGPWRAHVRASNSNDLRSIAEQYHAMDPEGPAMQ